MEVALVPVPHALAVAVIEGAGLADAVAELGLTAAPGWPHADTADALRPLAEHGARPGTFLVTVAGELVGECGWFGPPDDAGEVEVGYGLAGSARGRGLGTAAVRALVAWVETQPGVRRIRAEALVGNAASRRLLERLGFRELAEHPPYVTYVRDARHVDGGDNSG